MTDPTTPPERSHDPLPHSPDRRPFADRYTDREKALLTEHYEIETLLAAALGYEPYPPGSPGYHPDQVNYVTGDHTAVTLAMEAAAAIQDLRARLAAVETETAHRVRAEVADRLHRDRFHPGHGPDTWYAGLRHARRVAVDQNEASDGPDGGADAGMPRT